MSGWTVQRIPAITLGVRLAAYGLALLAAILLAGLLSVGVGLPPLRLGGTILYACFATRFGLQDLALLATPLILCGLSVLMLLRVGLWNIGADGQFYVGATCAAAVGLFVGAPPWLGLPLAGLAGAAGGAAWIALPAFARLVLGVSEIITTLLLNFVARLLVDGLATGAWRDVHSSVTGQTQRIPIVLPRFPHDWHFGPVHAGVLAAPAIALLLSLAFRFTRWGYELRLCGANPQAAAYGGMPVRRRLLQAMLLGGAIAGLAGAIELTGTVHRLESGISNGYGYTGIIVAVLAAGAPLGAIVTGLLMAVVLNGGTVLQIHGLPAAAASCFIGVVLLVVALAERLAHYRLVRLRPAALAAGRAAR